MIPKRIGIIGAGIGGLVLACRLASKGHRVSIFEKNSSLGGKCNQYIQSGFRFDTGPSLVTMPFVLEEFFKSCETEIHEHLTLRELDLICKYHFDDGTVFNNFADRERTLDEIRRIAPEDEGAYRDFLKYSQTLYEKTAETFLLNPLADLRDFSELPWLNLMYLDAFATVNKRVSKHFNSTYLRQFANRFTTYNGSSPFLAPATLNVIAHVELNLGAFYLSGGIYSLIDSLVSLATSLDVKIHPEAEVESILVEEGRATGLRIGGEKLDFDIVASNADANFTYLNLLKDVVSKRTQKKIDAIEPSCGGYVLLIGKKNHQFESHHNIFFSGDYRQEFDDIFRTLNFPIDPTVYVANTSATESGHAPAGAENLFILINTPYLTDENRNPSHQEIKKSIFERLAKSGYELDSSSIIVEKRISPLELQQLYHTNRGSIYGTSSNSMFSAFIRPRNRSGVIRNLYLVGGSTHPGGGIPLVFLSARHAETLIERDAGT